MYRLVLKLVDVFFLKMVVSSIELVLLKRYFRPVLLIDAPGGQDLKKNSNGLRNRGWTGNAFLNAMDGGLQGSHSAISLHLVGVALEFAILPGGSRRLLGVVEKGGMLGLVQNSEKHIFFPYQEKSKKWHETVSRMDREKPMLCVIPLSVATIWLTVTNKQDNSIYGYLKYSNLSGLKYMVFISGICASYALIAAVSTWIRCIVTKTWLFFVSDQIVAYLMVTSGTAVLEILYLAYNGDREVSWSEACTSYGKFCYRMKLAAILHALALSCFIILAVISAYRAFSIFEPPLVPSKAVEGDRA
ncbi:hypothetical protein POTOM_038718 [Populus tomentosa]|uniref:CASP-like protein n=1 Tax=Populus tomentosa TaxID=118781 RepID=A0A8X7Z1H0_POPTO|nr:hypothetical protein POTOM_038718 [Populus tomentosa]